MENNEEVVEKISEEAVKEMLDTDVYEKPSTLPIIILGVATLGVGFLIYKGVKYLKNKNKCIDITPTKEEFVEEDDSDEE